MTPYEKAGFDEKSLFRSLVDYGDVQKLDIVWLLEDDGSGAPDFTNNKCCMEHSFRLSEIQELARDEDGYYIWEGDEQPVPDDWFVEVKLDTGSLSRSSASNYGWAISDSDDARNITAFRVVSTGAVHNPEPSTKTKEKFSWNETVPEIPYTGNGLEFGTLEPTNRKAEEFLHQAAELMAERGKEYDKPTGERSMGQSVNAFNAITGRDLSEAEGWLLMSLVKRVRQYSTPSYHKDSAEDAVAYAALEAEALESAAAKCDYPDCNCPYDMGADNKCLRGLNTDHLRKGVR